MSLADKVFAKPEPPKAAGPKAPGIAHRIKEAEALLAQLERDYAEASLAWAAGDAGEERLNAVQAKLDKTHGDLAALTAAYGLAQEKDAAAERAARAALQQTQIRAVRSHLAARDAAAEALTAALADAVKHYKAMLERSAKARAASPIGGSWPAGSMCAAGELKRLVEVELYRASALLMEGHDAVVAPKLAFPGASPHDLSMHGQPEKLQSLPDALKQATTHVIGVLTGQVVE